jgi:hypothetical protein
MLFTFFKGCQAFNFRDPSARDSVLRDMALVFFGALFKGTHPFFDVERQGWSQQPIEQQPGGGDVAILGGVEQSLHDAAYFGDTDALQQAVPQLVDLGGMGVALGKGVSRGKCTRWIATIWGDGRWFGHIWLLLLNCGTGRT